MSRPRMLPVVASARRRPRILAGLCVFLLASACHAQSATPPPEESAWLAVSDQALAGLRGGFDTGAGLVVSFGISREVLVNGQVVSSTSFQLGDIGKLTPEQAQRVGQQLASLAQVVQNGPGNSVAGEAGGDAPTLVIQNTLNNQTIRSETAIQATTSGLSLVKGLNLQATINDAISGAIGHR
jgi:hypothetical protein